MRVIVHLTLDGIKETQLEGDSAFLAGAPGDELERKGLGFWLSDWQTTPAGPKHKGQAFIPWSSALYVEEMTK
jgi:hypothetical protein